MKVFSNKKLQLTYGYYDTNDGHRFWIKTLCDRPFKDSSFEFVIFSFKHNLWKKSEIYKYCSHDETIKDCSATINKS